MSNITLNIVEPGSGPVVPDTGLFTAGIRGPEATAIGAVIVLAIATIVVAILYKKHKKQNKTTRLVHLVDNTKAIIKSKKRVTASLTALALLASAGTFAALLSTTNKNNTSALEGDDGLTLDISSEELTIEVGDEPVFAILPVDITVEQATEAGYTLTTYTEDTNLVSTTDPTKVIPMVTVDNDELVALEDNTYGLSLAEPETKDDEAYTSLSTDQDNPTFITDKDYEPTEAEDTTTIYYGFYITPGVPYGTYTGSDIYYDAEVNCTTTLTFNGNDSDGGEEMESVIIPAGDSTMLPPNTYTRIGYEFVGWNTNEAGTGQAYTDGAEYTAVEGEFAEVILYAQWEEPCPANSICYKANGANTGNNDPKMSNQSASSNTDTTLWASNFIYDTNGDGGNDYGFAGWSEDKNAANKINSIGNGKPTIYGPNQTITTGDLSTKGMRLYAVWIAPANENSTLQGFACPSNTDMPIGSVTALKDNRDNQVYTVAKLADGNCWMTENLRLADTHKEGGQTVTTTITSSNTHNPASGFTALAASSVVWCNNSEKGCINFGLLNASNTIETVTDMTSTTSKVYSYGNYYNWYSATVAQGTYSVSSGNAVGDICPTDWILPYGGNGTSTGGGLTSGGFYYLYNAVRNDAIGAIASNKLRSFPNNFVYSGYWYGSSSMSRGSFGRYWSSTAFTKTNAFELDLGSVSVGTATAISKSEGYSIRCVALGQ